VFDSKIKAGEEFIETTNKFKKELDETLFPGKAKEVETLHEMLDVAIDSTKMDLERTRKSKITESGVKTHHETDVNYDVDLAISNIINGRAMDVDFEHFKPGNTANRQAFYETTGIKLPEDSRLSNYILNALNNKEKRIHDIYLKHNTNDLKQPDSLTPNDEGGIIESDIYIHKSLGAKVHRDDVLLPNGRRGKLKENSKITKVVTFAGKGTKKSVKISGWLSEKYKEYKVHPTEWKKTRGDGYVVCDDGTTRHAELHWFESDKTGRVEMKVKRYFDNES